MPVQLYQVALLWILVVNVLGFVLMGIDKGRAKKGSWRISEKTLFLPPLLGGTVGAMLGMKLFRHKTRHWYFVWGFRGILVVQIALIGLLYYYLVL